MMLKLSINGNDYSNKIIQKTYSVNQEDIGDSWIDGNLLTHLEVYRQSISGSFSMTFTDMSDYDDFIADMQAVKSSGAYTISLYVQNLNQVRTITCSVELTTKVIWATNAYGGDPAVAQVKIKFEEL